MQTGSLSEQPEPIALSPSLAQCNFAATIAPTVNDDESLGYAENSVWYKTTATIGLWLCVDSAEGAAVWRQIPLTNSIAIGSTAITGGTTNRLLYDNAGVVAEAIVGSGLTLSGGTLSASLGLTIGSTSIASGTNNRVLYQSSGVVQQSASFTFDGTTLTVGSVGRLRSPNSTTIFLGATPHGSYSGTDNLIMGVGAGANVQGGTLNVLGGSRAGEAISSGTGNLLFGYAAGYGITTGSYNTAFGYAAMSGNASYCVALGQALGGTTGSFNIGIGYRAGVSLTTGYNNTLIGGDYAGGVITDGIGNTCIGYFAGKNITTGDYNVAIGYDLQLDSATGNSQTNINNTFIATSTEARIGGRDFRLESGKTLSVGGTQFRGYTTSASAPTTTQLPNDKDWCFHNDTGAVEKYVCINMGGTIYGVVMPAV